MASICTVPVVDLDLDAKSYRWELPISWLEAALVDTEATPVAAGLTQVELTKNGSEIMVRGHASATVSMPCVRTLKPVTVALAADLFLLLTPKATQQPNRSKGKRPKRGSRQPAPEHSSHDETASLLPEDNYTGDEIVLDPFIREFLILELPMAPHSESESALGLETKGENSMEEPTHLPRPSKGDRVRAPFEIEQPIVRGIDPRLKPLAELAKKLRGESKE